MLRKQLGAGCAALCVLVAVVGPAHVRTAQAKPECTRDAPIRTAGEERANRQPIFIGLTASGDLMEVRSTSDGGWTVVLTLKDGSSCAVASGNGWETVERLNNSLLEPSHSRTRVD